MSASRWFSVAALIVLTSTTGRAWADSAPATDASGSGDLARCADAAKRQDADGVIALCGAVIDATSASDDDKAHAYANRGTAYLAQADFTHALDDLSQALKLKPDVPALYDLRSQVYVAQGDFTHALDDLTEAIKRAPDQPLFYSARGDAYEGLGDVAHAVGDHIQAIRVARCGSGSPFAQAADTICPQLHDGVAAYLAGDNAGAIKALDQAWQQDGKDLHLLLWLTLARQRDRQDATTPLNTAVADLDLGRWPGPLVRYYLGRFPAEQLQQAAQDPIPRRRSSRPAILISTLPRAL
jgi:lipoprotein NlpI